MSSEQAKLAFLEAQEPDEKAKKYTRYVDMPPPTPKDEAEFDGEFQKILSEPFDGEEDELEEGPGGGQTGQDWLKARGATIPDFSEWQVPLYLDKYKSRSR